MASTQGDDPGCRAKPATIRATVLIPSDIYETLKAVASKERRSVSSQVVAFIEQGFAKMREEE